jgi:hypothetical protein
MSSVRGKPHFSLVGEGFGVADNLDLQRAAALNRSTNAPPALPAAPPDLRLESSLFEQARQMGASRSGTGEPNMAASNIIWP